MKKNLISIRSVTIRMSFPILLGLMLLVPVETAFSSPFKHGNKEFEESYLTWVQRSLKRLSFDVSVNGIDTPNYRKAVRNFRKRIGMSSTGSTGDDVTTEVDRALRNANEKNPHYVEWVSSSVNKFLRRPSQDVQEFFLIRDRVKAFQKKSRFKRFMRKQRGSVGYQTELALILETGSTPPTTRIKTPVVPTKQRVRNLTPKEVRDFTNLIIGNSKEFLKSPNIEEHVKEITSAATDVRTLIFGSNGDIVWLALMKSLNNLLPLIIESDGDRNEGIRNYIIGATYAIIDQGKGRARKNLPGPCMKKHPAATSCFTAFDKGYGDMVKQFSQLLGNEILKPYVRECFERIRRSKIKQGYVRQVYQAIMGNYLRKTGNSFLRKVADCRNFTYREFRSKRLSCGRVRNLHRF